MMKKRKQRDNRTAFMALQIFRTLLLGKRRRIHYALPILSAVSACLFFLFTLFSSLSPSVPGHRHEPHLRLPLSFIGMDDRLNVEMEHAFRVPRDGGGLGRELWSSHQSRLYYGCSSATREFPTAESKTHPKRYLLIATSGGLNQQRTGITDAVVAAYILNATLVVPKLDQKSFWKDSSNFSEIFDVDWFIAFLSRDVKIIKQLPTAGGKVITPHTTRVPRKCNQKCYESRILPILNKKQAVELTKFDYRLSNHIDSDLQKLRCRTNYHALKFTDPILELGRKLVERMRTKSKHYIALHLRFEPDMLAFSGCYFGGGDKETQELGKIRKRWKNLHEKNPEKERRHGKCPLTPEEVGLMLRGLGFSSDVHVYVASGDIYGGEEILAPLKALFPNFHTKETIASEEELGPFSSFSSRMAALDFIVCDESDVFVTNNNGNMARMLAGRRRYFGHKPTIRPNAKKLFRLFMNRDNMTWEEFASKVGTYQVGFMGEPNEVKPGQGEFHENPADCICEQAGAKNGTRSHSERKAIISDMDIVGNNSRRLIGGVKYEQLMEEDQYLSDTDDLDNETDQYRQAESPTRSDLDSGLLSRPEQQELEEMFSD